MSREEKIVDEVSKQSMTLFECLIIVLFLFSFLSYYFVLQEVTAAAVYAETTLLSFRNLGKTAI